MFLPDCNHRMLILLNFAQKSLSFHPTPSGIRKNIHPWWTHLPSPVAAWLTILGSENAGAHRELRAGLVSGVSSRAWPACDWSDASNAGLWLADIRPQCCLLPGLWLVDTDPGHHMVKRAQLMASSWSYMYSDGEQGFSRNWNHPNKDRTKSVLDIS